MSGEPVPQQHKPGAAAPPPPSPAAPAAGDPLPEGLVYVSDAMPGIARLTGASRGGFAYRDARGRAVRDEATLARIRKLAIPPAYTSVWICPDPRGHLQATGRDARGRKQYRYHAGWQALREADKFDRMQAFGQALPRIRARVARDLAAKGAQLTRERVLATLVRLLDTTFLRVGNDEYARENNSFGLTTLRNRHVGVRGSTLELAFRGKSGVVHKARLDDPRVARVVRRAQQLPGQELFQYEHEDGSLRSVGSGDVNDYLAEIAGATGDMRFTAKDFRTWHGSVQALELLHRSRGGSETSAPPSMTPKEVIAEVAKRLGNTPAVCRKAYIHPEVLALGLTHPAETAEAIWARLGRLGRTPRGLTAAEARLLALLRVAQRAAKRTLAQQLKASLKAGPRSGRRKAR